MQLQLISSSLSPPPPSPGSLRLPKVATEGVHCLRFAYHMYGYHVRSLGVFLRRMRTTSFLWLLHGEQGKHWLVATFTVLTQPSDVVSVCFLNLRINSEILFWLIQLLEFVCACNI